MLKHLPLLLFTAFSSNAVLADDTTELKHAYFPVSMENVGDYWVPAENVERSSRAAKVLDKMARNGGVAVFRHDIDGSGNPSHVEVLLSIPEDFMTTKRLLSSELVKRKYRATDSNQHKTPVTVTKKIFFSDGAYGFIPDSTALESFLNEHKNQSPTVAGAGSDKSSNAAKHGAR